MKTEEINFVKPVFRQSQVQYYFKCPKMYKLSLEFGDEIEPSMAMRQGLIFERMVLGEKPDHDEEKFKKEVYGKITAPTIELIQTQANKAKDYFLGGDTYQKLLFETDNYIITGEADYIGEVLFEGEAVECIGDLKYTSNINEIWNKKERKEEFLQAIFYPYMLYKLTGKLLPFVYVIVENTLAEPLIKAIKVNISDVEYSFRWLEDILDAIANDIWFEPKANENNCLGYKSNNKCRFFEFCSDGKKLIADAIEFDFERLF